MNGLPGDGLLDQRARSRAGNEVLTLLEQLERLLARRQSLRRGVCLRAIPPCRLLLLHCRDIPALGCGLPSMFRAEDRPSVSFDLKEGGAMRSD